MSLTHLTPALAALSLHSSSETFLPPKLFPFIAEHLGQPLPERMLSGIGDHSCLQFRHCAGVLTFDLVGISSHSMPTFFARSAQSPALMSGSTIRPEQRGCLNCLCLGFTSHVSLQTWQSALFDLSEIFSGVPSTQIALPIASLCSHSSLEIREIALAHGSQLFLPFAIFAG
jgi:hypothetical protein